MFCTNAAESVAAATKKVIEVYKLSHPRLQSKRIERHDTDTGVPRGGVRGFKSPIESSEFVGIVCLHKNTAPIYS